MNEKSLKVLLANVWEFKLSTELEEFYVTDFNIECWKMKLL